MPPQIAPETAPHRAANADWLDFARTLKPASVDLLYADPPFNTGQTKIGAKRNNHNRQHTPPSYADAFPSTHAWVQWLSERILATLPALKQTASILIHVDWRTAHHARILLDKILGPDHFVNHLVWSYGLGGSSPRRFARKHDDILFYAIDPQRYYFNPPMVPATSNRMRGENKKATDVLHVPSLNNMATERTGYPTQKPIALLTILTQACCPDGGTVLDPCCGSGTTLVAAASTGRLALGCDTNPQAVAITTQRLLQHP